MTEHYLDQMADKIAQAALLTKGQRMMVRSFLREIARDQRQACADAVMDVQLYGESRTARDYYDAAKEAAIKHKAEVAT